MTDPHESRRVLEDEFLEIDSLDEESDDSSLEEIRSLSKARMRDWIQAFTYPSEILVATVLGLLLVPILFAAIGNASPTLARVALAAMIACFLMAILLCFGAIWSQFAGIVFDARNNRLTFPAYSIRRAVALSEIQDANSESISGGTIIGRTLRNMAQSPRKNSSRYRMYVVNLSGRFGSRPVRFLSKRRRDQFLSLLRVYAPQARITRFATWN
jgi:hypothetical protein